jgi:hypothetical protein
LSLTSSNRSDIKTGLNCSMLTHPAQKPEIYDPIS